MRGQRLFVRPIDAGDGESVRAFLARWAGAGSVPRAGLIGKVAGDLVAVMALDFSRSGVVRIDNLVVAEDYRRKRVGRAMMRELESLAAKMERDWLVANLPAGAQEFLRKVGFVEDHGGMVRRVER